MNDPMNDQDRLAAALHAGKANSDHFWQWCQAMLLVGAFAFGVGLLIGMRL